MLIQRQGGRLLHPNFRVFRDLLCHATLVENLRMLVHFFVIFWMVPQRGFISSAAFESASARLGATKQADKAGKILHKHKKNIQDI